MKRSFSKKVRNCPVLNERYKCSLTDENDITTAFKVSGVSKCTNSQGVMIDHIEVINTSIPMLHTDIARFLYMDYLAELQGNDPSKLRSKIEYVVSTKSLSLSLFDELITEPSPKTHHEVRNKKKKKRKGIVSRKSEKTSDGSASTRSEPNTSSDLDDSPTASVATISVFQPSKNIDEIISNEFDRQMDAIHGNFSLDHEITCYFQAQLEQLTDKTKTIGEYLHEEELALRLSSEMKNSYMVRLQSILSKRITKWRNSYEEEKDELVSLDVQLKECLDEVSTWLGQKENNDKKRNMFNKFTSLGKYDGIIASHFSAEQAKQAKQTKQAKQIERLPDLIQTYIQGLSMNSVSEETFLSKIYEGMLTERLEDNDEVWRNLTHQVDVTELFNYFLTGSEITYYRSGINNLPQDKVIASMKYLLSLFDHSTSNNTKIISLFWLTDYMCLLPRDAMVYDELYTSFRSNIRNKVAHQREEMKASNEALPFIQLTPDSKYQIDYDAIIQALSPLYEKKIGEGMLAYIKDHISDIVDGLYRDKRPAFG